MKTFTKTQIKKAFFKNFIDMWFPERDEVNPPYTSKEVKEAIQEQFDTFMKTFNEEE